MKKTIVIILVFLSSISSQIKAQSSEISLNFKKTEMKIGEQVEALLEIRMPVTVKSGFPALSDTLTKSIEVVEGEMPEEFYQWLKA